MLSWLMMQKLHVMIGEIIVSLYRLQLLRKTRCQRILVILV